MRIEKAQVTDLNEILNLQYLAYQSEARLNNNFNIPPLLQTLEEIQKEFYNGIFLKAMDDKDVIIGSVRGYINDCTLFIGKLIVHPDYQGNGIGTKLLKAIEAENPKLRYELFTSSKSLRNIRLYERLGYSKFMEKPISTELTFIYLEKYGTERESYCNK